MRTKLLYLLPILFLGFLSSCEIQGDGLPENIDSNVCANQTPIVFAHGLLASGDTYEKQIQRFVANGICKERMFTFDWNSLGAQNNTQRLYLFIEDIIERTNAESVYLVGHSAGSTMGFELTTFQLQSKYVEKYVHLAGNPKNRPAGPNGEIPTLNIYSDGDNAVPGGDIPGAINLNLVDKDHYEVATSLETFVAMYDFFYGTMPNLDYFDDSPMMEISGKVLSFGENLPAVGAHLEIYELDSETGFRISDAPQFDLRAGNNGFWGPIDVKRDTHYEFLVYTNGLGDRPVHYYREPFNFPNPTVIIRNYPPTPSLGTLFLSGIPNGNDFATVAFFGASQAAINGRDILKLNGELLSTPQLTAAEQTIIAMFCYDRGDQISSYNSDAAFSAFPFLNGADVFIPTETPQTVSMEFNGRSINMRNWKSKDDGVSVAVFN